MFEQKTNNMKILIISYLFAPNNEIGAIRLTKIAKGLADRNYSVDIVTLGDNSDITIEIPTGIREIYSMKPHVPYESGFHQGNIPHKYVSPIMRRLKTFYRYLINLRSGRNFYKFFLQQYDQTLKYKEYDVVITTFGPLTALLCGLYYKRHEPSVKWICDFRDPPIVEFTPFILRPYFLYIQYKSCRLADQIVAVSNGCLHRITKSKFPNKSHMIPNGFDLDDRIDLPDKKNENSQLVFTYVGSLYEGKRKITPLFQAIAELFKAGVLDLANILFIYAGSEFSVLQQQAAEAGLADIIIDYGQLDRKSCLELQHNSDFLILSTWNTKKEKGVFTGKFLEYMLIGKPIIAIITGECPGSEVAVVIKEGNLGIAFEEANEAVDFLKMKEYIKHQYDSYFQSGTITFSPNQSVVKRYDYRNIVEKFEALIND